MFDIFTKLKGGRRPAARLALVAFGKHPGWNDFIRPSIGLETEALSQVRHSWYEIGLKALVDSGGLKRLEGEKRLEGFDHVLVWLRPGHAMFGQFWSSSDGIGRKEYPMVLCVDGEGMPLEQVLASAGPELDRLREFCKQTSSAEPVQSACRLAQERLQALLDGQTQPPPPAMLPPSARERFLDHASLGPNRVGLLRVLHQLGSGNEVSTGGGTRTDASHVRPCHLRLPLAGASANEAVLLWTAFLQAAVSVAAPVLFLLRHGENWLDVMIGEPMNDDLVCLQASLKAIPLATEIPYEISDVTSQRMQTLAAQFLHEGSATISDQRSQAAAITSEGAKARAGGGAGIWWGIGIGVVVLIALAGFWLAGRGPRAAPLSSQPAPAQSPANSQERYERAIRDGQTAFEQRNFAEALTHAEEALQIKHNDPAARQFENKARQQLAVATQTKENEQKYLAAMTSGNAAKARQNYPEAMAQAEKALGFKPDDTEAKQLRNLAQAQLALAARAKESEHDYEAAMANGKTATAGNNYAEALTQAEKALGFKPGDAGAMQLREFAQAQLASTAQAKENERQYLEAMTNGSAARVQKNYAEALALAQKALGFKPGDPAALQLGHFAQAQLILAAQTKENERSYQAAMASAKTAKTANNYAEALTQAEKALGFKPGDAEALQLGNFAQAQLDLAARARENEHKYQTDMTNAQATYAKKEYAYAGMWADEALKLRTNDPSALQLKAEAQQAEAQEKQSELSRITMLPTNPPAPTNPTPVNLGQSTNPSIQPSINPTIHQSPPASTNPAPVAGNSPKYFTNSLGMEFVRLRAGTGRAMWVGKYEVTQKLYRKLMVSLPEDQAATSDDLPVANVPFKDAGEFCRRLGEQDGRTYALPTKAEWLEVAGLPAGSLDQAWKNLLAKDILDHEVTSVNLDRKLNAPLPVGSHGAQPNQVCDLFGNVREWVQGDEAGESAGFAYNSSLLNADKLFLSPSDDYPWLVPVTGFRCFLLEDK